VFFFFFFNKQKFIFARTQLQNACCFKERMLL